MEDPQRAEWYAQFIPWLEGRRPFLEQHNFREGLAGYPHIVSRSIPWTAWERVGKPLSEARIAFVSSSGAYLDGEHEPFDAHNYMGDTTYRTIPWDADRARIRLAQEHYDHAAADQDLNVVLPLELLRRMREAGAIGQLVEPVYTISGYLLDAWKLRETTAREIAHRVYASGADAALLAPV